MDCYMGQDLREFGILLSLSYNVGCLWRLRKMEYIGQIIKFQILYRDLFECLERYLLSMYNVSFYKVSQEVFWLSFRVEQSSKMDYCWSQFWIRRYLRFIRLRKRRSIWVNSKDFRSIVVWIRSKQYKSRFGFRIVLLNVVVRCYLIVIYLE